MGWLNENVSRATDEARKRIVSPERARVAATRLIYSHFHNPGEHARMSIPVNVDDDDIVIHDFITQQRPQTDALIAHAVKMAASECDKRDNIPTEIQRRILATSPEKVRESYAESQSSQPGTLPTIAS
jgi:hypothetical protein